MNCTGLEHDKGGVVIESYFVATNWVKCVLTSGKRCNVEGHERGDSSHQKEDKDRDKDKETKPKPREMKRQQQVNKRGKTCVNCKRC